MKMLTLSALVAVQILAFGVGNVVAAEAGALRVESPWARETADGQRDGGGFLTLVNDGGKTDQLVGATSPVSAEVQIHTVEMEGGMMRMRELPDGVAIPAHGRVELKPGSLHVMFIRLKHPLRAGDQVPVTLRFRDAGERAVTMEVRSLAGMPAPNVKTPSPK